MRLSAMRARELEIMLEGLTPRSSADLDLRCRALREARMLPTGGRGPHAPEIDAGHAATIVLAAAASRQATEADKATRRFARLKPLGGATTSFCGAGTLGEAVEAALSSYEIARTVARIEITVAGGELWRWDMAVIYFEQSGKATRAVYLPESALDKVTPTQVDALGQGFMRDVSIIGKGMLCEIAAQLDDDGEKDAGWTTDVEIAERGARIKAAAEGR